MNKVLCDLLNKMDNIAFQVDVEGKIFWVNDYSVKKFGGRKLLGKKVSEIGVVDKNSSVVLIEGIGSYKIMEIESTDYEDGKILLMKSLEVSLDDEQRLFVYEDILENVNDGVIITDRDGRIVYFNRVQEIIEKKDAKEMVGKYLWDVYDYDSEDDSEHREVFKNGKPLLNKYRLLHYRDGLPRYISYNTYPIIIDGETVGVYSISKSEEKLHSMLAEVIDIKRKYISHENQDGMKNIDNGTVYTFSDIVGDSDETKKLIKEAENIALLDRNILIIGETGTGKEVYAQSIHNYGKKRTEPFVAINCGAIPENLMESILFGTVKGAYTGAIDTLGLFEKAKEGTLFLDELNSLPVYMQTKLLRVLQERKVRRVGGLEVYPVSCRVISAINEDPKKLVERGLMRKDLFYRISGIMLHIAPLRDRKKDIDDLIRFYINKYNKKLGIGIIDMTEELRNKMLSYSWPGNVRELEYFVENLMIRADADKIELGVEDLPDHLSEEMKDVESEVGEILEKGSLTETLSDLEKRIILAELNKNNWNISKTSRELKIVRQSLLYRMKRLGIEKISDKV